MTNDYFIEPDMGIIKILFEQNITPDQFRNTLVTFIISKADNITKKLNSGKSPSVKDSEEFQRAIGYLNRLEQVNYQPGHFFKKNGEK